MGPFLSSDQSLPRGGAKSGLATAKADHRAAYTQLPVTEEREKIAVVTLKNRRRIKMGGFTPQTQLPGATAAALRSRTASRMMATLAARWFRTARVGFSGDFRTLAKKEMPRGSVVSLFSDEPDVGLCPEERKGGTWIPTGVSRRRDPF